MTTIAYHNIAGDPVTAEVISISGEVIDINRSTQTHLHASGGGAYASSHNGRSSASVSPISVSSTNSVHDDVYILTETGEEVFVQLINWERAGIRKGHQIQLLSFNVNVNNRKQFPIYNAVVNNRSLNRLLYDERLMGYMVDPVTYVKTFVSMFKTLNPTVAIICIVAIIFCLISVILIPLAVLIVYVISKKFLTKFPAVVAKEVKPKLNQILLPPVSKATA